MEPSDQTVKEFEDTVFLCTATGNPAPKITWMKDGETVADGDTLSFPANRSDSGKYLCSAENGLGLAINSSASLDVQCKYKDNANTPKSHLVLAIYKEYVLGSLRNHTVSLNLCFKS